EICTILLAVASHNRVNPDEDSHNSRYRQADFAATLRAASQPVSFHIVGMRLVDCLADQVKCESQDRVETWDGDERSPGRESRKPLFNRSHRQRQQEDESAR